MSKYGNQKTICDGHVFDSKAEMQRYTELKLLARAGAIMNLKLQPRYVLQKAFYRPNKDYIREIAYVADFEYTDRKSGRTIVEDVKGFATKDFNIKKKLFLCKYPDYELVLVKV